MKLLSIWDFPDLLNCVKEVVPIKEKINYKNIMPLIKSTATTQLLVRKKKKKKKPAVDKTDAQKTRIKSIKKSLNGKVKNR